MSAGAAVKAPAKADAEHVVNLTSPAIARAIVAEFLLHPELLNSTLRDALSSTGGDKAVMAAIERMPIWADLSALVSQKRGAEAREWRSEALTFCVLRSASFELLTRLFKVTRGEVSKLRQELQLPSETRPKGIPNDLLEQIFTSWAQINKEQTGEIEAWIHLAGEYPQIGLNSLYQVIVKDSAREGDTTWS